MIFIPKQAVKPVAFEQGFESLSKVSEIKLNINNLQEHSFNFTGKAFVVKGYSYKKNKDLPDKDVELSVTIDDQPAQVVKMPTLFLHRKHDVYWNYALTPGDHKVVIRMLGPTDGYGVDVPGVLVY